MANLVIDLQEGFKDDTVVILVNEQEVFQKQGLSTDYSIGFADRAECQGPPGKRTVEVRLPQKNLTANVELDVQDTRYLGVKIHEGRIEFKISDEMFIYF
jgi:hypothetical protein